MSELEIRLRSLLQSKSKASYDRLPTASEGSDGDMRLCYHNGYFYLAIKMRNQWRFFPEAKATNYNPGESLSQTISTPPTTNEVSAIQNRVNDLIKLLRRKLLI